MLMTAEHWSIVLEGVSFFMMTLDLYGRERLEAAERRISAALENNSKQTLAARWLALREAMGGKGVRSQVSDLAIFALVFPAGFVVLVLSVPGGQMPRIIILVTIAALKIISMWLMVSAFFALSVKQDAWRWSRSGIWMYRLLAVGWITLCVLLDIGIGAHTSEMLATWLVVVVLCLSPLAAYLFVPAILVFASIIDDVGLLVLRRWKLEGMLLFPGAMLFLAAKCLQW